MKLLSFSYNDDCSTAAIRAYYGHSTHDMTPVTQRVPRPSNKNPLHTMKA